MASKQNLVYFRFWFYYQTITESVSKKIVEGTDVFVVLPTEYYKDNAVYNYYVRRSLAEPTRDWLNEAISI